MSKKISIANNCICKYTILYNRNGSAVDKKAAFELQKYLQLASGQNINICCDDCCCGNEYEILVGNTNREADVCKCDLGDEGFVIFTQGSKLFISGSCDGKRGTLYGVYEFLEKFIGWRFASVGFEILACDCDVDISDVNIRKVPVMEYRDLDWPCTMNSDWCVKNQVNAVRHRRELAGDYGGGVVWGGGFVHTFGRLTDIKEPNQPCLSDPEMLEKAIASVRELLSKTPDANIISVSQNDNMNYCKCDACAAVDEEEGSHMGTLLRFVNAVADDIKDDYPNVAVETLAYQYTRKPPLKTRPRDNIIIRLCSIECCFSHALDDSDCSVNAAFKKDIEGWNEICDRLYVWDYVTNYSNFILPFPNFGVLLPNMKFFADHSVKGMYPEGNYQTISGEFGDLRAYMLSKCMWDPYMSDADYSDYMDAFLQAYYGKGWKNIRAFIDFIEKESQGNHFLIWTSPFDIVPREVYEANYDMIAAWWDAAEAQADNAELLDNVKRARYQWTLISLTLKIDPVLAEKTFDEVNARGIRWNEWHKELPRPDFETMVPQQWYNR